MELPVERLIHLPCRVCGYVIDVADVEPLSVVHCPTCGFPQTLTAMLGPFRLMGMVGTGSMGDVYKAWDPKTGRPVAIKVLRKSNKEERDHVADCIREARALAALSHGNVVEIFSIENADGHPYIVMELLDGGRLDELLTRGPLAEARALQITIDIASGLRAAQRAGLVHRDIKPANVLFNEHGLAKLVDFGVARKVREQIADGMGTPYYVAPEVALKQSSDHRADIYSLGVTLYQMLAGRAPFEGQTRKEVIAARFAGPATDLRDLRPLLCPLTADIVNRMLAFEPQQRYGDYDALLADLRQALWQVMTPGASRGGAAGTGAAATGATSPEAHDEARPLTLTQRRRRVWLAVGAMNVVVAAVIVFIVVWQSGKGGGPAAPRGAGTAPGPVVTPAPTPTPNITPTPAPSSGVASTPPPLSPPVRAPAFPGAQGFGADAVGGRGGVVMRVTSLEDDGPGSLRAAIASPVPRIVVITVAGVIALKSPLVISDPFVTIVEPPITGGAAGGRVGLCLKNFGLHVRTHDVVIRHLRIRPGDGAAGPIDGLWLDDARDVVVDHCSLSWATGRSVAVTGTSRNVTVQWCMITESLDNPDAPAATLGTGVTVRTVAGGVSLHHNLIAHHHSRVPLVESVPGTAATEAGAGPLIDFRSNVVYDWAQRAGFGGFGRIGVNYVNNYLLPGPATMAPQRDVAFYIGTGQVRIYLRDNLFVDVNSPQSQRNELLVAPWLTRADAPADGAIVTEALAAPPVRTDPPADAMRSVLLEAGATLPDRDAVDARIVQEVQQRTGRVIRSQDDVGGWPRYIDPLASPSPAVPDADADGLPDAWEQHVGLSPADPADARADNDGDGYTNIEEYLNGTDPRVKDDGSAPQLTR